MWEKSWKTWNKREEGPRRDFLIFYFFLCGWDSRGIEWKGVNLSEKVKQKTIPLQSDIRAPLSLCHCLFPFHPFTPQENSACFGPLSLPAPSFPSSLIPSFLGPTISPLSPGENTFFFSPSPPSSLSFFICHTLTQSLPVSLGYSVAVLSIHLHLPRSCRGRPVDAVFPARWRKCTNSDSCTRARTRTHGVRCKSAEVPADVPFVAICCEKCDRSSQEAVSHSVGCFFYPQLNIKTYTNSSMSCKPQKVRKLTPRKISFLRCYPIGSNVSFYSFAVNDNERYERV